MATGPKLVTDLDYRIGGDEGVVQRVQGTSGSRQNSEKSLHRDGRLEGGPMAGAGQVSILPFCDDIALKS